MWFPGTGAAVLYGFRVPSCEGKGTGSLLGAKRISALVVNKHLRARLLFGALLCMSCLLVGRGDFSCWGVFRWTRGLLLKIIEANGKKVMASPRGGVKWDDALPWPENRFLWLGRPGPGIGEPRFAGSWPQRLCPFWGGAPPGIIKNFASAHVSSFFAPRYWLIGQDFPSGDFRACGK